VRAAYGRPGGGVASSGCGVDWLNRVGGLEHENLDREVGIDVVLTHECDDLAIELPLHDFYEVVTHLLGSGYLSAPPRHGSLVARTNADDTVNARDSASQRGLDAKRSDQSDMTT
jgi:hypothetical protein